MYRYSFVLGSAVAWICLGAGLTRAQTPEELKRALLPTPQLLRVQGEPRVVRGADLSATVTFPPETLVFDPVAIVSEGLGERPPIRRTAQVAPAGLWALGVTDNGGAVPAEVFEARRAIAERLGPEGYVLETFTGGTLAVVVAGGKRGLLYGAQTLAQLLAREPGRLPAVRIEDAPVVTLRELHVHGFDKGYGAGDLKSLTAYVQDLPAFLPYASRGRYNLFRLSLDAGWINQAEEWVGPGVDSVMRELVEACHRHGIDVLMEVRLATPVPGARVDEPHFIAFNPIHDGEAYEKALRRALRWGADVIDVSMNDLVPMNQPAVLEKYGVDGRFSGKLVAELLHTAQGVIASEKPGTPLHTLPRFYGGVHWEQHPNAMPDLWRNAPKGVAMYITASGLSYPLIQEMREKHGARFVLWTNYTSNHTKELRVMLTGESPDLREVQQLPQEERRVLINLGYPIGPQRTVALALGELLWNPKAYETFDALGRAAAHVWGKGAGELFLHYARLLDFETMMGSRGQEAAALLAQFAAAEDDPDARADQAPPSHSEEARVLEKWEGFLDRATKAAVVARELKAAVSDPHLQQEAEVLYWNARRVELDARAGVHIASGRAADQPVDARTMSALLAEHERILADHYPVERNDPKSAEVVTRGIRRIREALQKID